MEILENMMFNILYWFAKALYCISILFIVWVILSSLEIAFTFKSPDTIPTYSVWNFFYLF